MALFQKEKSNIDKIRILKFGIFSHVLSLIYVMLAFALGNQKKYYVDYGFIALHVVITFFAIFIFLFFSLGIFNYLHNPQIRPSEKEKMRLVLRTFPHRVFLSILYLIIPIGMYFYNINQENYLYLFKWLPIWFPVIYLLGEKYIIWKEKKINSPIVRYHNS
jgi:hypothetical protein